jgi:hypothetical protein
MKTMNSIFVRRTNYPRWPERFHPFWRSAGHRNKVSCGAVYQWETGKFVPKDEKKAVLVALRKLGRREARGSWVPKPFSHPKNSLKGGAPEGNIESEKGWCWRKARTVFEVREVGGSPGGLLSPLGGRHFIFFISVADAEMWMWKNYSK